MPDGQPILKVMPLYRTTDRDKAQGQDEQRRRVRELLAAIGMKTEPSDNQIARTIDILGPFVPGLTIDSPLEGTPVPDEFSVPYVAPTVGRPKLNDEECRRFAVEVERRLSTSTARLSRKALLARMAKEAAETGAEPSTPSKAERWDFRGRELLGRKPNNPSARLTEVSRGRAAASTAHSQIEEDS
jgi:hypothetical protein